MEDLIERAANIRVVLSVICDSIGIFMEDLIEYHKNKNQSVDQSEKNHALTVDELCPTDPRINYTADRLIPISLKKEEWDIIYKALDHLIEIYPQDFDVFDFDEETCNKLMLEVAKIKE